MKCGGVMSRIVLKFGGSSVGDQTNCFDDEHMIKIAETIKDLKSKGNEVIVVISAMAGVTRMLKTMCMAIDNASNTLEDDIVLTTGEQISTGLLCKLLNSEKFNIKAKPFLGWQIPIITNNVFGGATIKRVEAKEILSCLKNNIVPVIAGYQGITENNEITTLGFDGSDTTAVAVSAAVNADICQFYKDVRGIFSANPRRVPKANKLEAINTYEMFVLSSLGARILHPVSIKTALDNNLTLRVVPNFTDNETGSTIDNKNSPRDILGITYFEHNKNKITISVVGKKINLNESRVIIKTLNNNKIFAEVVNTEFDDMSITFEIGWIEQLDRALQSIHTLYGLDIDNDSQIQAFKGEGKQVYKDPAIKS
jgi:aspartate kinase